MDNLLIFLVIGLAIAGCVLAPLVMLVLTKHQDRVALDHYGKYRGRGPAKSFVCPDCRSRSYAPSHIAGRFCAKCRKSFPEKKAAISAVPPPQAQAAE